MISPFTDDHEIFRRQLAQWVKKEVTPNARAWEKEGKIPRAIFERMGALGWLGVGIDPEYGGSGLDFWNTVVLVQELVACRSIGVAVSVLAHAEFSIKLIDHHGSPDLKKRILAPAIAGTQIGALGVTEPGAGSDVAGLATKAVLDGDHYIVNGSKTFISNGSFCDFVTTAVRTNGEGFDGITILVIPSDTPGFTRSQPLKMIAPFASQPCELYFDDCRVPVANRVGAEGSGFMMIMEGFEGERLVLAIIMVEQMRIMLDEAVRYGKERHAFGHPLLSMQVWQHRLADVLTRIEAAEALTYRAIELYVCGRPSNAEISMAKLFASETIREVSNECSQIFGGHRIMEENLIARLDACVGTYGVGAGTSEIQREIIARAKGLAASRVKREGK